MFRSRWTAMCGAASAAVILTALPLAGSASADPDGAPPAVAAPEAASHQHFRTDDGYEYMTHGADRTPRNAGKSPPKRDRSKPAPEDGPIPVVVRADGSAETQDVSTQALPFYGTGSIVCDNSGTRFRVIYAVPTGKTNRGSTLKGAIQQAMYNASGYLDDEAGAASQRLRVQCISGTPDVSVASATLPTAAGSDSFQTIVNDLRNLGYTATNTKYMVFYDDSVGTAGGQGTARSDDRLISSNDNNVNTGSAYAIDYAEAGNTSPNWQHFLHEMSHNMGAVQHSAPHATGGFHCWEGADIMCYNDGAANGHLWDTHQTDCGRSPAGYDRYDCFWGTVGGGDYFSPFPPAGSYLVNHWNLAHGFNTWINHG